MCNISDIPHSKYRGITANTWSKLRNVFENSVERKFPKRKWVRGHAVIAGEGSERVRKLLIHLRNKRFYVRREDEEEVGSSRRSASMPNFATDAIHKVSS